MDSLEIRLLLFGALILAIFGVLFIFAKRNKNISKSEFFPKSLEILTIMMLLAILFLIYAQARPSTELSIIFNIIASTLLVLIYGVLLWAFRALKIFKGYNRFTAFRFGLVSFLYVIYFTIVCRGIAFLVNGLMNPDTIALTPELENIVIPSLAGLAVASYRLTALFKSKVLESKGSIILL